jgi:hypothetical protein
MLVCLVLCLIPLMGGKAFAGSPAVSLSPTSLTFSTQLKGTTSPPQTVTLTNTGTGTLALTAVKTASPFSQTNTCSGSIAAGASCTISVSFTPTANGTVSGTLSVLDNATGSPQTVALSGTGTVVSLTPATVNFGNQLAGTTSSSQTITMSNIGAASVRTSAVTIQGANPSDFSETNNCGTVAAGASCSINVSFTPAAVAAYSAIVNVTFVSSISPVPATLTGSGVAPGVSLSPMSLTFAAQQIGTTSPTQNVTLTNTGQGTLTLTSIVASAQYSQTNTCGTSVAAGGSCTISVACTPTAIGTQIGTVTITDNASGSPQAISLTGTGQSQPVVSLSPTTLTFASQSLHTTSSPQTVTLTNTGGAALSITSIAMGGLNPGEFTETNTCGSTVNAGGACTISVQFQPTYTGTLSASLLVTDNASGSPQSVALSGTAPNPLPFLQQPLAPTTLQPGGAATTLTVNGTGFGSGSSVLLNGNTRATSYVSSTQLQVALLASDIANPGTEQITVTNPAPGGGKSNAQPLQVTTATSTVSLGSNTIPVQSDPRGVAVADFNLDGSPDVAIVNRGTNAVSVLLGNGNGTFQTAQSFTTGVDPIAIAVGDINGDGFPDIVTANRAAYTISVLFGNGNGTFQNHLDYTAGTEPMALTFGDFSGDGYLDVAVVNNADSTVSIFLGGPSGLQPQVVYPVGPSPIAIVTGDFNGDGILDLAVANSGSDSVSVLLGNGDGTFQAASTYVTGTDPDGLVAADVNGDGKLDLITANNGSNSISVLINAGNGTFPTNVTYSVGSLPFAVVAGDFFGNGILDLAVGNSGQNTVSIVPGIGNGTFNPAAALSFPVGNGSLALAAADFNLDGRADLIATNSQDNTATLLLQIPGATLSTDSLAFGSENVGGETTSQAVTLSNTGSASLSITSIALTTANASQFVETNNCPSALAAGANCTINVSFEPTMGGSISASLAITDNGTGSPQTVSLLGTGVAPAVTLSPASLTFASQTINTTSAAQAVSVTNSGSEALTITSVTASSNYAQTNNCGTSLAAGAACTINVTFTPTTTGTISGTITLVDNAPGGSQTIGLTGTGSGSPGVSLSPSTLTFASQTLDTTSPAQTITLTNTGTGALTLTGIAITGNYSETNTCGSSVAAGANCAISVTFTPTATGTLTGSVVVTDNASGSPQSVTTTGTGATDLVAFSPTSLSFGNQTVNTNSSTKVIKLTNNTGAKLTISKIAASAGYSETNTCGTGGGAGGTCNIVVTFTPTAAGSDPGTITITDNATNSPQTIPLTGTGIAASTVFSPSSVTFADQTVGTSSSPSAVTLTNSGTAALTVSTITITGTNAGDYSQTNTCPSSLAAGAFCTINATFTPAATGTRTADISVSDSASGTAQVVPLTGTGIAPAVTFVPTSLTFANQAVGTSSAPIALTLSNSGNATLTINSISIGGTNPSDFTQTNNCSSSLAAGTSCTINVTFTPTASGTRQANISVSDNASGSPQTVALTGSGTTPLVSFSATSITFPSQAVGTTSASSGVTLFNTGNATLNISSITITGTDAGDFSETNTCAPSVSAGSNCTITITFTPEAVGTRTASVSIADNAVPSPQTISLTGTATSGGPAASISPSSLTFGSQNLTTTSSAQPITLTNSGGASLNLTSIVASGDFAQTNNCGTTLAAQASCTVQVTFSPTNNGTRQGYVTFTDNDPSTIQAVTLTGTGATPSSTVSIVPMQSEATPGQSVQFTASISGTVSSNVTWAVDGVSGGNSTTGTISPSGLYTAPSAAGSHIVTATSTANTTQTASVPIVVTNYAGTFVYHNDNGRTGQNLTETVLTTGNVNSNQFGKLFVLPVDGQIYAEPLYVQGVSVAGQGTHNVVFAATQNDSVFAFDADGLQTTPLWQISLLPAGGQTLSTSDIGGCANISPQVGITSTPVIDPATNIMYVVARSKIVANGTTTYYQYLHAIEINSGIEVNGGPVQIQATINANNGPVSFNPQTQNQRAGLFVENGVVYIAWASHCDIQPYHGWLMGYQESNLQQVAVYNSTPNGQQAGIWQSGAAPAVDEYGYIYLMNGNGTTDVMTGGTDYGEGLMKLNPGNLTIDDYFVPSNYQTLNSSDLDLGSGGPMLIPNQPNPPTQMLVAAGKQGMVYLVNQTDLGEYNSQTNNVLQTLPAGTVPTAHSMPAYWQNNVYFCGVGDYAKSYLLSNGLLSTEPTAESPETFGYPGATPAVSANETTNGILWVLSTVQGYPALLHAFDATNVSRELYNSDDDVSRDQAGMAVKFVVPTVANGKVYIGTQTEVDVYGLLAQPTVP